MITNFKYTLIIIIIILKLNLAIYLYNYIIIQVIRLTHEVVLHGRPNSSC